MANVMLIFQANVTSSVINCYTDLVKQITVAIHHEEERCQYLSSQAKIMLSIHDEVAAMPEGETSCLYISGSKLYSKKINFRRIKVTNCISSKDSF